MVDFEDVLFWSVALVQVIVAVRFSVLMHGIPRRLHHPRDLFLARGQFKDGLLAAALFWIICLSKSAPLLKDVFEVGGAFVLAWLILRTLRRMGAM